MEIKTTFNIHDKLGDKGFEAQKKWVAVDDVIKVVERLKAKFDSRKVDHTTSRKREIKSLKRLIVLAFQELNSQSNENKKEEKQ